MDKQQLKELIRAAKGKLPFDKYFYNARIVDVYTEKVIENASVGVKNGIIVSVCPEFKPKAIEMIDCENMYLAPSFIDAHMHIESSKLTPYAYCEGAIPHGTGCVFFDPMQIANTSGETGVGAIYEMLKKMPLESYMQFPSHISSAKGVETAGGYFSPSDTKRLMKIFEAKTLGEVNAADLESDDTLEKLIAAGDLRLSVNGHCPAMGRTDITAAVCAGLYDDHECESFDELLERLSWGMAVFIREGTIEKNCQALVSGIVKNNIPTDNIMFCTDDKSAEDIKQNGCIDKALRIAVRSGLSPITAVKMATLNAARHYHIEDSIGSVTPSRKANFLLLDNLEDISVHRVYFEGKLIAKDGRFIFTEAFDISDYPKLKKTVILPNNIDENSLLTTVSKNFGTVTARVIEMPEGGILTKVFQAELKVKNGFVCADTENDILPIAVIERFGNGGNIGKGFIKGLGIKRGAVAASFAQESNNIVAAGADKRDMLAAIEYLKNTGGGAVVCLNGKVIGFHAFPVAGILSDKSLDEEIKADKAFREKLLLTGSKNPRLIAVLTVSLCSSIPDAGLTDKGLIDVKSQKIIPVIIGSEAF